MIYETTISTLENPAETEARVPEPKFIEERPGNPAESAACWPEAPHARLNISPRMAADSPARLRLGSGNRLKQGRDFLQVRREGERMVNGCMIANWRRLAPGRASRIGVITSGKLGNAVMRSRARRLLREAFRVHQHDLSEPIDLVLVARASIVGKGLAEVEKDFLTIVRKAGLSKKTG